MIDRSHTVHSRRTPAEAFGFIADGYFQNHPAWDPAIVGMQVLSPGPVGVGTRGRELRRFVTKQAADFEITGFERPSRFALRNTSGPFELDREYRIDEDGIGTSVSFSFRMKPKGAMKLLFPLIRGSIEGQVKANIDRLAHVLDANFEP